MVVFLLFVIVMMLAGVLSMLSRAVLVSFDLLSSTWTLLYNRSPARMELLEKLVEH